MLMPQWLEKWRSQQLHPVLRHHPLHLVGGVLAVQRYFLHFAANLFKKLLKATGLADEGQFGLGRRRVRPDVWNATRQPDAGAGRQIV